MLPVPLDVLSHINQAPPEDCLGSIDAKLATTVDKSVEEFSIPEDRIGSSAFSHVLESANHNGVFRVGKSRTTVFPSGVLPSAQYLRRRLKEPEIAESNFLDRLHRAPEEFAESILV
jgi:hypothetical protein